MRRILVSGGFDPLHSGHVRLFQEAKALGDHLTVAVNSDAWLIRKKGAAFMPFNERAEIIRSLVAVDAVTSFNDDDGTACAAIQDMLDAYPDDALTFANGGDRNVFSTPEQETFPLINYAWEVGGDYKANSSSWLTANWYNSPVQRTWGSYQTIYQNTNAVRVKILVINPGCSMSLQRHAYRKELWVVAEGSAHLRIDNHYQLLTAGERAVINLGDWHQCTNLTEQPCKIIEIQTGNVMEEDIERAV